MGIPISASSAFESLEVLLTVTAKCRQVQAQNTKRQPLLVLSTKHPLVLHPVTHGSTLLYAIPHDRGFTAVVASCRYRYVDLLNVRQALLS